jgi:NADH:ubiquinone oxidoreductase subunit 6 (subunit J)
MTAETFLFYVFSSIALISGVMVIRSRNPVHSVLFLILVFCNAAGLLILLDLDFFAMIFLVVYVGAIAVLFLFVVMMLHIKFAEIHENVLRYLPVGGLLGFIFLFEILLVVENDLIPVLSTHHLLETMTKMSGYSLEEDSQIIPFFSFFEILLYKFQGFFHNFPHAGLASLQYYEDLQALNTFPLNPEVMYEFQHYQEYQHFQYTQWPSQIVHMTNIEGLGQLLYTYYFYFFLLASLILLIAMIGAIVLTMHKGIDVKRQEVYEQNTREFAKTVRKFRDFK